MIIAGIGIVFNRGRGLPALKKSLEEGWLVPKIRETTLGNIPVYPVAPETLKDRSVLGKIRRADRFSKMAVLAARDAVNESGLQVDEKTGIILATAFGPHATTFKFLDDILTYGDGGVSPTLFSSSVHNAAASYIALVLECRGPTMTVTQFSNPFHQALLLAETWLLEDRCEKVLVGTVDELGPAMEAISAKKLEFPENEKLNPFAFSKKSKVILSEGSCFFLLTKREEEEKYGEISTQPENGTPDLVNIEADGLIGDETGYREIIKTLKQPPLGLSPIFGSILTGSSFHAAAGAIILNNKIILNEEFYVVDEWRNIVEKMKVMNTIKVDCNNKPLTICLRKK